MCPRIGGRSESTGRHTDRHTRLDSGFPQFLGIEVCVTLNKSRDPSPTGPPKTDRLRPLDVFGSVSSSRDCGSVPDLCVSVLFVRSLSRFVLVFVPPTFSTLYKTFVDS